MHSFFLLRAPAYHSFTFNLQFLYELKYKVRLPKFSIFDSVSFLLKLIFLFNKKHEPFDFKRHNSFQSKTNIKAKYGFPHRPLIFKLHQEFKIQ